MDDLLPEFLTESNEHLETLDRELVRFEADPNNHETLRHIFRVVHTIKGTCGFLNLPRLEALAHAAETVMGRFRDGAAVSREAVSVILATLDRIKLIMADLGQTGAEPAGDDHDLIGQLHRIDQALDAPDHSVETADMGASAPDDEELDALERAFRETEVEVEVEVQTPPPHTAAPAVPAHVAAPAALPLAPSSAPSPLPAPSPAAAEPEVQSLHVAPMQTLRVKVETLERLMTMVSELVLTRNQLVEIARHSSESHYMAPLQRLSHITGELQDAVMKTRMQPIGAAWTKLPRIVRDLAQELGKSIELVTEGEDTELDRQVLELIKDPLTHMIRNSSDHGIERPEVRLAQGKPATGTIRLSALHEDGAITIRISDDGRGLDLDRIRAKAIERKLASEGDLARMPAGQIARLIFHPGLSTAEQVTGISGRGVGMDVVKANIDAIGGSVDISTVAGKGTTLTLRIPLTLAIISTLIVEAHGERFCIPQLAVRELVRLDSSGDNRLEFLHDAPVFRLREKLLPVATLSDILKLDPTQAGDGGFLVVLQAGGHHFGVRVDSILQTEDIVVKPLASCLSGLNLFAGNTILGDGTVVLIMEPVRLAAMIAGEAQVSDEQATQETRSTARQGTTTLLIFRAGSDTPKALPLSVITRLEDIDASAIETSGDRLVLQYRGTIMPIIPANDSVTIRREGLQPLIVISDGGRSMGLAIDDIVDIIEDDLAISGCSSLDQGVIGNAILRGRTTDIIDIAHFLPQAHPDWLIAPRRAKATDHRPLLLVEGSDFLRDMLMPVLSAAGFAVTAVADGAAAIAVLDRSRFDAIIVDLDGADAAGLLGYLGAHGHAADGLLVARATFADATQIEMARRAGIAEIVAKFDRRALLVALSVLNTPHRSAA